MPARTLLTRMLGGLLAAGLTVAGVASPAQAAEPFGASQLTVNCLAGTSSGSIAADGTVRGFVPCSGDYGGGQLNYFRATPGQPIVHEASPYSGQVLSTAWDGVNALYVVFASGDRLLIGKRLSDSGRYATATVLATGSRITAANPVPYQADLVASNGKWWAVWSRQVGAGTNTHRQLYQEHSLLGSQGATLISNPPVGISDSHPSLSYSRGRVNLVWTRTDVAHHSVSTLRLARSTGGSWTSQTFTATGVRNDLADSVDHNGILFVIWQRDEHIVVADNSSGHFVSHTFGVPGTHPVIDVSDGKILTAWTASSGPAAFHVLFTEESEGRWTSVAVNGPYLQQAIAVLGHGGLARVLYSEYGRVKLVSQH